MRDWVQSSSAAAALKLPWSATATSILSWLSFMSRYPAIEILHGQTGNYPPFR
jgi:hypothetical protein